MKKSIFIVIILFSMLTTFGQKRTIEIYTNQETAAFIPIINKTQMSDTAVKYYKYETDFDEKIQLLIHFPDSTTADLYEFIDFSGNLKNQKYEIVLAKKAKLLQDYSGINRDKTRPAYMKFNLKNRSFGAYLSDGIK